MLQVHRAVVTRTAKEGKRRPRSRSVDSNEISFNKKKETPVVKKKFPEERIRRERQISHSFLNSRKWNANDSSRNCHDTLQVRLSRRTGLSDLDVLVTILMLKDSQENDGEESRYSTNGVNRPLLITSGIISTCESVIFVPHVVPCVQIVSPLFSGANSASGDRGRSSPSGDRMQTNESNSRQHDLSRTTTSNETLQQTDEGIVSSLTFHHPDEGIVSSLTFHQTPIVMHAYAQNFEVHPAERIQNIENTENFTQPNLWKRLQRIFFDSE